MKKIIVMTVVCCILMCSLSAFAVAENIIIDGETLTIPADMGKVCEKDDRTFVPLRFIAEYLGCYINYTDYQQGAAITNPNTHISYYIMADTNNILIINGDTASSIVMDTKTFINNDEGRMYVPVRYLANAFGYDVDWDEATQTVVLTSAE